MASDQSKSDPSHPKVSKHPFEPAVLARPAFSQKELKRDNRLAVIILHRGHELYMWGSDSIPNLVVSHLEKQTLCRGEDITVATEIVDAAII